MLYKFLEKKIIDNLNFAPNKEQLECIEALAKFCTLRSSMQCFLLKGYAGTGKTSIVSALVKAMDELEQSTVLLAPTGRAAKVFAGYSGKEATSIHKRIYRQKSITEFRFVLDYNKSKNTLFIVDEASMIGNNSAENNVFGSGRLLDDLIEYVYTGDGCQMILLGDEAQLLPVGQGYSPALTPKELEGFSLELTEFTLTQVVRQSKDSGILYNATQIRNLLQSPIYEMPKVDVSFDDIENITGVELIDSIQQSYDEVGKENTIVITRSNNRANQFNKGIRNTVLQQESEISNYDFVMITKNNYFWSEQNKEINFIANGEIAEIIRIHKYIELYGFRFIDTSIRLIDYDIEIDCILLLDSLTISSPKDIVTLNKQLFEEISKDYENIKNKRKLYKEMRSNVYLNALQVKFAYAITCHKAQGGQWKHVYVDVGYLPEERLNKEFLQWLYTAFTRSQEKLFLINFKKEFLK